MSMLEYFFSVRHAGEGGFSEVSLSGRKKICQIIKNLYNSCDYLFDGDCLNEDERDSFRKVFVEMEDYLATDSLNTLSSFLSRYYGKKLSFFWMSKRIHFSDLNNLEVVTSISEKYETCFGFTEEVFAALDEYGMGDRKQEVKRWYDGFTFGRERDIYNLWSILNFLYKGKFARLQNPLKYATINNRKKISRADLNTHVQKIKWIDSSFFLF